MRLRAPYFIVILARDSPDWYGLREVLCSPRSPREIRETREARATLFASETSAAASWYPARQAMPPDRGPELPGVPSRPGSLDFMNIEPSRTPSRREHASRREHRADSPR